jgi:hypothetical protein
MFLGPACTLQKPVQGCIEGNCQNGDGTYLFPSGARYTGQFANGRYNGRGTYVFPEGRHYEGEFKNNRFHGQGTLTFPSGKRYTGQFRRGRFHGRGLYTFPSGKQYQGWFEHNRFIGARPPAPDLSVDAGAQNAQPAESGEVVYEEPLKTEKDFEDGLIEDVFETRQDRRAKQVEQLRQYERNLSTPELERMLRTIPARRVADNLRIYRELLRRQPDNPHYQRKVRHYEDQLVQRQGKRPVSP